MVERDVVCFSRGDAARLVGCLIDAVFPPGRLSDGELVALLGCFNELLTAHPELHALDARVFGFHQALIVEHDQRATAKAGGIAGQLGFGDIAPELFGVEVAF